MSVDKGNENWVPPLSEFLWSERHLGEIEMDLQNKKIRLATLGEIDLEDLRFRLNQTITDIERSLTEARQAEGDTACGLHYRKSADSAGLRKPACPTARQVYQWREIPWPELEGEEDHDEEEWKLQAVLAAGCAIFGLSAYALESLAPAMGHWAIVLYTLSIVAGGWDAALDTAENISRKKLDIHFLMLAVALGAVSIGAWSEGALLLFLFSFSGALEHYAFHRTRREIDGLFHSMPETARVVDKQDKETDLPIKQVLPGMRCRVKPGELFPLDGLVIRGKTAADEANLTGESVPVEKGKGDTVFSGTLNLWGVADVQVTRPARESALQKIIRLIERAQHLKAPSQRFTDKFGTGYTVAILSATTILFFVWWLIFGLPPFTGEEGGTHSALYRAMTFLVVTSPCALVLSIPSAILAAIAWGAKRGILFRGGAAVENLAEVNAVALDKTGTLTTGEMLVERVESFPEGKEQEVAEIAFALERHASHPIARAVVEFGRKEGIREVDVEEFTTITGQGVKGSLDGSQCVLGRRELLGGELSDLVKDIPEPPFRYTEVWVITPKLLGRLLLRDEVRPQSRCVLERLKAFNLKTVMLTGDRRDAAEEVARELGLDEIRAGLKPEQKVEAIEELKRQGLRVAMVGDGMNDAPCLAAADVSVAMGARGSDAALEQSEVILMRDEIENFLHALHLSKQARGIIRQNLAIALGTVIVMAISALGGWIPLAAGVFAHEGSTVLVCMNSLRLLFLKRQQGCEQTDMAKPTDIPAPDSGSNEEDSRKAAVV